MVKKEKLDDYWQMVDSPLKRVKVDELSPDWVMEEPASLVSLPHDALHLISMDLIDDLWANTAGAEGGFARENPYLTGKKAALDGKAAVAWTALKGVAQTCRRLRELFAPQMYSHVVINKVTDASVEAQLDRYRASIESVYFRTVEPSVVEHHLRRLPRLTSITLLPCELDSFFRPNIFSTRLQQTIQLIENYAGHSIKSFQLVGAYKHSSDVYHSLHPLQMYPLSSFAALRTLRFRTMMYGPVHTNHFDGGEQLLGRLLIVAQCPNLVALELCMSQESWPSRADFDSLPWVAPLRELTVRWHDGTMGAGQGLWFLAEMVSETLVKLVVDGKLATHDRTVLSKLEHLELSGDTWQSFLTADASIFRFSPLKTVKVEDEYSVFQTSYGGDDALSTFATCMRGTKAFVRRHTETLKLFRLEYHWSARSGYTAQMHEEVREEYDAIVGTVCKAQGTACEFIGHP